MKKNYKNSDSPKKQKDFKKAKKWYHYIKFKKRKYIDNKAKKDLIKAFSVVIITTFICAGIFIEVTLDTRKVSFDNTIQIKDNLKFRSIVSHKGVSSIEFTTADGNDYYLYLHYSEYSKKELIQILQGAKSVSIRVNARDSVVELNCDDVVYYSLEQSNRWFKTNFISGCIVIPFIWFVLAGTNIMIIVFTLWE